MLTVAPARYLAIDGAGDPNTEPFGTAIEALYPLAYALKFASKRAGRDFVVPPLEGLWWADDMAAFTSGRDKSAWSWTLLLFVPEWIDDAAIEAARDAVRSKKQPPARLADVRVETLDEGLCVQTLHIGTFDDEAPLLARLHDEFIPGEGLRMTGHHHEIYLSDPRRTAPEKLRTILRQPVVRA
ncbi:GyrI-like domain-containing protein [Salinibacterium sp. ZJ70]|uniref:GyrI-like domain-containing protein n=1 Tax=Salinibacterium sp. ZJ70 TaxID=2708084 RepID=UPI001420890A|nr:GyrI-like domain-containing protein [Salinibacterium sp. ZJ70]